MIPAGRTKIENYVTGNYSEIEIKTVNFFFRYFVNISEEIVANGRRSGGYYNLLNAVQFQCRYVVTILHARKERWYRFSKRWVAG